MDPRIIIEVDDRMSTDDAKRETTRKRCADCVFCVRLKYSTLNPLDYECRCAESRHAYRIVLPSWFACSAAEFIPDDATVPEGCECPKCNEDRMDYLVWVKDDLVRCESCGIEYDPSEGM